MSGKSMLQHKRRSIFIIVGGLILLISSGVWMLSGHQSLKEYRYFASPDGHYRVMVMRTSVWPALMPGQASDVPGVIQLYDQNDNLLQEAKVEMVQLVDQVEWVNKSVHIKLVADWELPD